MHNRIITVLTTTLIISSWGCGTQPQARRPEITSTENTAADTSSEVDTTPETSAPSSSAADNSNENEAPAENNTDTSEQPSSNDETPTDSSPHDNSNDNSNDNNNDNNNDNSNTGVEEEYAPDFGMYFDTTSCDRVMDALATQCGISATQIGYNGICTPHLACEATCLEQTNCDAILPNSSNSPAEKKAYGECVFSCYANGPATCGDAKAYMQYCGNTRGIADPVSPDWNTDNICQADEQCIANCSVATSCNELLNHDPNTTYNQCVATCMAADLHSYPKLLSLASCEVIPNHPTCNLNTLEDGFCLSHPNNPGCLDLDEFCNNNPEDIQCKYRAAQANSASLTFCEFAPVSTFCSDWAAESRCPKEFNIQECNPVEACIMFPDAAFCQGESSGSWSRDGNISYCDEYPEDSYCQDHDSMCEYYPYSVDCAEWKSFCNMYPNSPECDTTYEPWCVRYPEDPDCDR